MGHREGGTAGAGNADHGRPRKRYREVLGCCPAVPARGAGLLSAGVASDEDGWGEPIWRDVSELPLIRGVVDEGITNTEDQLRVFGEVAPKPYVLDDATITRARKAFTTQAGDLWLFEEQARRWLQEALTETQRADVDGLAGANRRLRELTGQALDLIEELAAGTIEKTLAKSDLQLGLEALTGQSFPPQDAA